MIYNNNLLPHNTKLYTCEICSKSELTFDEMKFHLKSEHLAQKCLFCDYHDVANDLERHINIFHLEQDNTSFENISLKTNFLNTENNAKRKDLTSNYLESNYNEIKKEKNGDRKQLFNAENINKKIKVGNNSSTSSDSLEFSNYLFNAPYELVCPICTDHNFKDHAELERHTSGHFDDDDGHDDKDMVTSNRSSNIQPNMPSTSFNKNISTENRYKNGTNEQFSLISNEDKENSERVNQAISIPNIMKDNLESSSQGIINKLKQYYENLNYRNVATAGNSMINYWLSLDFIHFSSRNMPDSGWGCGFRNLQLLLSVLRDMPQYRTALFQDKFVIPSVFKLQTLIDAAWKNGFDPQGCQQLKGKIINTRKWIGATEIVAFFSHLRIKTELLDFVSSMKSGKNYSHPNMIAWIIDYFSSGNNCSLPPLYLQKHGHSLSIVGAELRDDNKTYLLISDPGHSAVQMQRVLTDRNNSKIVELFRREGSFLKEDKYQIVAIRGLVTSERDYQLSKTITSKRIS